MLSSCLCDGLGIKTMAAVGTVLIAIGMFVVIWLDRQI